MTEGHYSPVQLEQARLVSSLLYGTGRPMFVLNLPAFKNEKYIAYDSFHGSGPHGENPDQERTNQNAQISLKTTVPAV